MSKLPFLKVALSNLTKKPSTRNFPAENVDAKPNYRGRLAYDPEKCVNCGSCIKVCSPSAITRTVEAVEEGEKITYEINLTSCTFCGTCQDFCSTKAITLTDDYHMVAEDARDLVVVGSKIKPVVKGKLTVSDDCVFCTLCARNCPEGALTVDRATKTWKVDEEKCVKCGLCVSKCPKKALSFAEPAEEGVIFNGDACVYCTLCAKKCPMEAITVDRPNKSWDINRDACTKCGTCVNGCPKKALSMGPLDAAPKASAEAPKAEAPKAEVPAPEAPKAEAAVGNGKLSCSDACVFCTLCARNCPQEAITVDRANKTWAVDEEKCIQCGLCVSKCPKKALSL